MPGSTPTLAYAGFWRRVLARLIDQIIIGSIFTILVLLFGFEMFLRIGGLAFQRHHDSVELAYLAPFIILFVSLLFLTLLGEWLYYALMESSTNQGTIGKLALGIKVTDTFGNRLSFGRATARHFGKLVSNSMFGVGFLIAAFTERKQALHDMIASTLVVMK